MVPKEPTAAEWATVAWALDDIVRLHDRGGEGWDPQVYVKGPRRMVGELMSDGEGGADGDINARWTDGLNVRGWAEVLARGELEA